MASEKEQEKIQSFNEVKRAFSLRIDRCQNEDELIEVCEAIKADPQAALKSFFDVELGDLGNQVKHVTARKTKLTEAKGSIDGWNW